MKKLSIILLTVIVCIASLVACSGFGQPGGKQNGSGQSNVEKTSRKPVNPIEEGGDFGVDTSYN